MYHTIHELRSHELIREAEAYRLALAARTSESTPSITTTSRHRPTRNRLLAWLRG